MSRVKFFPTKTYLIYIIIFNQYLGKFICKSLEVLKLSKQSVSHLNISYSFYFFSLFMFQALDLTLLVTSLCISNNTLAFGGKKPSSLHLFIEFYIDKHHVCSFLPSFHLFLYLSTYFLFHKKRNWPSSLTPFCFHLARINSICCDFILVPSIYSLGVTISSLVSQNPSSQEEGLEKHLPLP